MRWFCSLQYLALTSCCGNAGVRFHLCELLQSLCSALPDLKSALGTVIGTILDQLMVWLLVSLLQTW